MLIIGLNLSMNDSLDTQGLLWIDYRNETRNRFIGWMTPYYKGRGVMSIYTTDKSQIPFIIEHELKHLKCWRLEGNKGYVDNFIKHRGCFEKVRVKQNI